MEWTFGRLERSTERCVWYTPGTILWITECQSQILLDKFGIEPREPERVEWTGFYRGTLDRMVPLSYGPLERLMGKQIKVTVEEIV